MSRRQNVPCSGGCGQLLWTGSVKCRDCRAIERGLVPIRPTRAHRRPGTPPPPCSSPQCCRPARKRGLCSTHYNKASGHYIGDLAKDPDRERARLRLKTHRRHDWTRLTDITPEYERALRRRAKTCPLCAVRLTDLPYLSNSKELDHIVPQGVGGTHTIGNVRIICRTCNIARPKDGSDYFGPVTLWAEVS